MVSKTDVTADVKKRMDDLKKKRSAELETAQKKLEEAQEMLQDAKDAADKATRVTDLGAFQKAKAEEAKAAAAVEMYTRRQKQLYSAEIITQKDSDAVIDRLLQYEKDLDKEFTTAIKEKLEEVREILKAYEKVIGDTESTINTWTQTIRPNYRTFGRSTYVDPETGETTDVSKNPVPVHIGGPYRGVAAANMLSDFFHKYDMARAGRLSEVGHAI